MKRKDIVKTINKAGELLDAVGGAVIKNVETGELMEGQSLTKEEIRAMQTAMCMCMNLIENDEHIDPLSFALKLAVVHLALKNGLSADCDGNLCESEGDAE